MINKLKTWILITIFCSNIFACKRYVLTGGPGVGKSTLISELKKHHFQIVPEAFTKLYQEAEKTTTLTDFFKDPLKLRKNLMKEQIYMEDHLSKKITAFLDRSTIDIIVFGDYFKVVMPEELRRQSDRQYDLIFFIEPLPKEFYKNDPIRKETYEESKKIHNLLKEAYKKKGYKKHQVIDVPFATVKERTQFILKKSHNQN